MLESARGFVGSCVAMCGPWHPSGGGGGDALGILVWMRGVLDEGCLGIRGVLESGVSWNQGCLGIRVSLMLR